MSKRPQPVAAATDHWPATRVEMRPVESLIPYARNARVHGDEQIAKIAASIKEWGWTTPLLVAEDSTILCGHGRLMAARKLGLTDVPVMVATGWSEAQRRAYVLADNQLTLLGEWNTELLKVELADLKLADFDLSLTGFDLEALDGLFAPGEPESLSGQEEADEAGAEAVDKADELQAKWGVNLGDLWTLGDHRIICGDCTDPAVIARLMAGEKAHICWTDPPWNVAYGSFFNNTCTDAVKNINYKNRTILNDNLGDKYKNRTILNDNLGDKFPEFCANFCKIIYDNVLPGAPLYMAMSPQEWPAIHEALSSIGFHWSSTIIWAKDSLVVSRKDYHTQYEPLYYAWRGDAARLCPVEDRTQSDLWQIPRPKRSDMHPCLSPDSIINSRSGYVRIGDVVPGDDVLGHDGKLHRVDAVTVHEYSEDIYRIQVRGVKMAVDATHNHPFLVLRKNRDVGFFEAGLLEVGDYILSPTGVCESDVADDPGEDVAFVAGLFAAEGSFLSSGHGTSIYPRFSLHKNEESLIARIQNATQKNVKVYPNGSGNGINVVMFDSCMGEKLLAWCGRGAANKKLPGVLVWSEKSQRAVFDGYVAGDGALIRHNTIAKTVSQALAGQLVILAESLGYRTTVNIHSSPLNAGIGERQFKNTLPCYVVTMAKTKVRTFYSGIVQYEGVDFLMRRIQTIARIPYDGLVTNLVVDGCHTFQTAIGMSHNTMKPIALVERSLQNSSKPGNLVFEPFSGSGTTLIASARTNRHARACELDPRYVSCALERWNELTGGMPVRVKA